MIILTLLLKPFSIYHEEQKLQNFGSCLGLGRGSLSSVLLVSGSKKQKNKFVEPSLRKAPPSIPNPTQN
ncbi:hypothetical protein CR513_63115, partial [Mucuna pruriens]